MNRHASRRLYESLHVSNTIEGAIKFALWAQGRRSLSMESIQNYFECSRASAYRYLAAFKAANGGATT